MPNGCHLFRRDLGTEAKDPAACDVLASPLDEPAFCSVRRPSKGSYPAQPGFSARMAATNESGNAKPAAVADKGAADNPFSSGSETARVC